MFSHKKKGLIQNWSLDVQSNITSQVAFLRDGIIFGTQTGMIVCVDFSGAIKWKYDSNKKISEKESLFLDEESASSIICTPLVQGKYIYFGTEKGELHCITKDGEKSWSQQLNSAIRGTPLITSLGKNNVSYIVVGSVDGKIHVLDTDGKKRKRININSPIESNTISVDNKLVVGCSDGKIVAFSHMGLHLWTYQTKGKITANIVVSELFSDGEKYLLIGSQDNFLYALSSDGELKWRFETGGSIISSAITSHLSSEQGRDILVGSCDNKLYCISPHGEKLWSYETDFWVTASPTIIDKDGFFKIFVGSYDQKLYVLDGEGDFNLSFMPGLAGIINQTGYSSLATTRDVGENKAKKLYELETQGHITSCVQIPDSDRVVVTTKQGLVYEFFLQ